MKKPRRGTAADYLDRLKRAVPELFDMIASATEDEFNDAFTPLLERAVTGLEQNSKNYQLLDETGLTATLATALRLSGLLVHQESHSNGHVDLTIDVPHCIPARRILAEAKKYHGPSYHIDGIRQLLRRYLTGRESRGLVIVYFNLSGIADAVQRVRVEMDLQLPLDQQGPTKPHSLKWSFLSVHKHSSGEQLEIGHIGCNMYVDPVLK